MNPHRRTTVVPKRRGLAPLELTLALPLLLMMMALMIIMGAAGSWKVRTSANARQAILRAVFPRSTDNDPKPQNWWPQSATMTYHGGGPSFLGSDPYVDFPVVRGPYIADSGTGNSLKVLTRTLDMTAGMNSGQARINHEPAMWSRLGFRNAYTGENVMFSGQTWQYGNMGIPGNESRRITHTYEFEMSKYNPGAAARTQAAANAILANPNRPALMVLDHDAELRAFHGHDIEFHPSPPSLCTHDVGQLQMNVIPPLLTAIDNVPRQMTTTFLRMYQQQLQDLEAMDPKPPDYAERKAELEKKIQQLQEFLATL